MKRIVLILAILAVVGAGVCAQEEGLRAGLQLGSDGFVSFLLYGSRAELGIKAKLAVVNVDYTD